MPKAVCVLALVLGFTSGACSDRASNKPVDLDLLFVIDNSASMHDQQEQLMARFDTLLGALRDLPGGFGNLHIGVVSTDLGAGPYTTTCGRVGGDKGKLQNEPRIPGCAPPGDDYIDITDADGVLRGNVANVDTMAGDHCLGALAADDDAIDLCDVGAAFRCVASLGTGGCAFGQPFESARIALTCDSDECPNPGFLRDGVPLAVVVLSDEDDCSTSDDELLAPGAQLSAPERCFDYGVACNNGGCQPDRQGLHLYPPSRYAQFFSGLKPAGQLMLAGITGPFAWNKPVYGFSPSCSGPSAGEDAYPAIRLRATFDAFGDDAVMLGDLNGGVGICGEDYSPILTWLADHLAPG
jgi:hypothetical protein